MNRMTILSPSLATIGAVAGKPRPLIVKPPSVSLLIQTMSWRRAVQLVVPLGRRLRLDDERAEQTAADLVGGVVVGVVHVRADGLRRELVGEAATRRDRLLGDVRHAVHRVRQPLTVEVDAGRFLEIVLEDRPDLVTLGDGQPRARPHPVVAERLDRRQDRIDPMLDLVDRHLEDLDPVLEARFEWLVAHRVGGRLAAEEAVDTGLGIRVMVGRRGCC